MSQLPQGLQTRGDICATESCDRRTAFPPDPHAVAFKFSVTVRKETGTLRWLCFKSDKYPIRKILEKCLLSASGPALRKAMGWGVRRAQHLGGRLSRTTVLGLRASQARCAHLELHTSGSRFPCWGSGSSSAVPVPAKQRVTTAGLPKSAALWSVHGSVAPISRSGTCRSSEKVLNAT